MRKYKQVMSLGIVLLSSMSFLDVARAQAPYSIPPPPDPFFYQKPEQIRPDLYPKDNLCFAILASGWRYYQRLRDRGSYPSDERISSQRKWETKKGCNHLYDENGNVNRIEGINTGKILPYPPEKSTEESRNDRFGSIYRSSETGYYSWTWAYEDRESAQNAANEECGNYDCKGISFENGFGVLADSSDNAWGASSGNTREQAEEYALERCQAVSSRPDTCEVILVVDSEEGTIFEK
jgi:hypothetical protein